MNEIFHSEVDIKSALISSHCREELDVGVYVMECHTQPLSINTEQHLTPYHVQCHSNNTTLTLNSFTPL